MAIFLVLGSVLIVAAAWPLATGRNLPGLLGLGFTPGDSQRLQRAPATYFRAMGAMIVAAGLSGYWAALVSGARSPREMVIAVVVGAAVLSIDTACLVWLLILTERHELFRWNKP